MRAPAADAIGLGLRPSFYADLRRGVPAGIGCFELIVENLLGGAVGPMAHAEAVAAQVPVVLHGVGLDLLGDETPERGRLRRIDALARQLGAAWFTDHLCFVGADGWRSHDLLPVPRTWDVVRFAVERIRRVQGELGIPFGIEPLAATLACAEDELPAWAFFAEIVHRSGCGALLELHNAQVVAQNFGEPPDAWIDALDRGQVLQAHVAGAVVPSAGPVVDTHDAPVPDAVWALHERAWARLGPFPVVLEWDADVPPLADCAAVAGRARAHRAVRGDVVLTARVVGPVGEGTGAPPELVSWRSGLIDALRRPLVWAAPRARSAREVPDRLAGRLSGGLRGDGVDGLVAYHEGGWFRFCHAAQGSYPLLSRVLGLWAFNQVVSAALVRRPPLADDLGVAVGGLSVDLAPGTVAWEAARVDEAFGEAFLSPPVVLWDGRDAERTMERPLPLAATARVLSLRWPLPPLRSAAVALRADDEVIAVPDEDAGDWVIARGPDRVVRAVRSEPALSRLLVDAARVGLGPALDGLAAQEVEAAAVQSWMSAGIRLGWWSPPVAG